MEYVACECEKCRLFILQKGDNHLLIWGQTQPRFSFGQNIFTMYMIELRQNLTCVNGLGDGEV